MSDLVSAFQELSGGAAKEEPASTTSTSSTTSTPAVSKTASTRKVRENLVPSIKLSSELSSVNFVAMSTATILDELMGASKKKNSHLALGLVLDLVRRMNAEDDALFTLRMRRDSNVVGDHEGNPDGDEFSSDFRDPLLMSCATLQMILQVMADLHLLSVLETCQDVKMVELSATLNRRLCWVSAHADPVQSAVILTHCLHLGFVYNRRAFETLVDNCLTHWLPQHAFYRVGIWGTTPVDWNALLRLWFVDTIDPRRARALGGGRTSDPEFRKKLLQQELLFPMPQREVLLDRLMRELKENSEKDENGQINLLGFDNPMDLFFAVRHLTLSEFPKERVAMVLELLAPNLAAFSFTAKQLLRLLDLLSPSLKASAISSKLIDAAFKLVADLRRRLEGKGVVLDVLQVVELTALVDGLSAQLPTRFASHFAALRAVADVHAASWTADPTNGEAAPNSKSGLLNTADAKAFLSRIFNTATVGNVVEILTSSRTVPPFAGPRTVKWIIQALLVYCTVRVYKFYVKASPAELAEVLEALISNGWLSPRGVIPKDVLSTIDTLLDKGTERLTEDDLEQFAHLVTTLTSKRLTLTQAPLEELVELVERFRNAQLATRSKIMEFQLSNAARDSIISFLASKTKGLLKLELCATIERTRLSLAIVGVNPISEDDWQLLNEAELGFLNRFSTDLLPKWLPYERVAKENDDFKILVRTFRSLQEPGDWLRTMEVQESASRSPSASLRQREKLLGIMTGLLSRMILATETAVEDQLCEIQESGQVSATRDCGVVLSTVRRLMRFGWVQLPSDVTGPKLYLRSALHSALEPYCPEALGNRKMIHFVPVLKAWDSKMASKEYHALKSFFSLIQEIVGLLSLTTNLSDHQRNDFAAFMRELAESSAKMVFQFPVIQHLITLARLIHLAKLSSQPEAADFLERFDWFVRKLKVCPIPMMGSAEDPLRTKEGDKFLQPGILRELFFGALSVPKDLIIQDSRRGSLPDGRPGPDEDAGLDPLPGMIEKTVSLGYFGAHATILHHLVTISSALPKSAEWDSLFEDLTAKGWITHQGTLAARVQAASMYAANAPAAVESIASRFSVWKTLVQPLLTTSISEVVAANHVQDLQRVLSDGASRTVSPALLLHKLRNAMPFIPSSNATKLKEMLRELPSTLASSYNPLELTTAQMTHTTTEELVWMLSGPATPDIDASIVDPAWIQQAVCLRHAVAKSVFQPAGATLTETQMLTELVDGLVAKGWLARSNATHSNEQALKEVTLSEKPRAFLTALQAANVLVPNSNGDWTFQVTYRSPVQPTTAAAESTVLQDL